ncbi:hypothetical protein DOTSEDRAFT_75471 [Dothistroma septosporum NZE10]|uniref:Yeast cell wall synthesis Kre9/Knh1-like N-terminal domain-containing protein n=1 Tax=Dothistroma septosporum (strain NZE10 / CBS 128990) TaxID=675120 RepID=M2YIF9_DOTSN|nr:hypothetical protein DOTSEDRAFT_75471 [Dothistroma septosporum NZE10]
MVALMFSTSIAFTPSFLILFLLIRHARSLGIDFTVPAGGATYPAGLITVTWSDAGGSPDESNLVAYTLELLVGGNSQSNSEVIQRIGKPNGTVSEGAVSDEIAADISQSIQNGFYMRMTSNTTTGDQVINYSERFTLINMNGTTESTYLEGANGASGAVSNVPEAQYNVLNAPVSTATPPAIATPTSTATAPPTGPLGPANSGMSRGQIAGLVAGGILALVGLISLFIWVIFFYRRIKRKREERRRGKEEKEETVHRHVTPTFLGHKAELATHRTSGLHFTHTRVLNPQTERFEMDGLDNIAEVPASPIVYELEGNWTGWEANSGRKSKAYDPLAL